MTQWQRGFRQAELDFNSDDFNHDGYKLSWQLANYPAEFQAGYHAGQNEIEESIDAAAQSRIFDS